MNNNPQETNHWIHDVIIAIGSILCKPNREWFLKLFLGALLACSTVSAWIRAVAEENRYKNFYHHLQRIGKQERKLQNAFIFWMIDVIQKLAPDSVRIILVGDDSPNKRYGPKIEGAFLAS